MRRILWLAASLVVAAGLALPATAVAQVPGAAQQSDTAALARDTARARRDAERQLGPGMSQAELLDRLRQSGMTRAQMRTRLQQMGYDPGLADQYFDAIERGGEPPRGAAPESFVRALE